jgi:16S rRNA (cytidine1402-2'-O)-methyltransferase
MPGLSDPGYRLIAACREAGLRIEVVPGPSAVPAALVASGLPTARFVFDGFLPRTGAARRRRLEALAAEPRTVVVFESPHRLAESLADMAKIFGPRRAAIARELTKLHEEVVRGTLDGLAERFAADGARGEITIVIEGAPDEDVRTVDHGRLAEAVAEAIQEGATKREAIATVAAREGLPKKVVYQAVLDARPRRG